MIEVIKFLFENVFKEILNSKQEEKEVTIELEEVGFSTEEISRALEWFEKFANLRENYEDIAPSDTRAIRHFTIQECQKLNKKIRGALLLWEEIGILTPSLRELIINRVLDLDVDELEFEQFQWLVTLILLNVPDQHERLLMLETLILKPCEGGVH